MLCPVGTAQNRAEYEKLMCSEAVHHVQEFEQRVLALRAESFTVAGECLCCETRVPFLVDMKWGGRKVESGWLPNWRERLECPLCHMNNRQRLMAGLVKQSLAGLLGRRVYFMEQTTPIFHWSVKNLAGQTVIGSEYLGPQFESGVVLGGVRHEDVEHLSFVDGAFDLIVSNDVFEHVPHYDRAFTECCRVLRPGGTMLATIPFTGADQSVTRAELCDGRLHELLPGVYHGNPVSADGSLVFTDFGWDMLDFMRAAGFSSVSAEIYVSVEFGHLGHGLQIFRLIK